MPLAILQQRRQKERKSGTSSTSSTSLLQDCDTLHYRSIEDNVQEFGGSLTESKVRQPPSLLSLITPQVLTALIVHGILCFSDISIQVLIPLMWSTSLEHGGLGFTPYTIGLTLGIFGAVNVSLQVMLLGKLIRRFGPRKVVIVSFPAFLLSLSCFPLEGYFARRAGGADWRVWTVIMVQLTMDSLKFYAFCKLNSSYVATPFNISVRCTSDFNHRQCAMPVCPWLCDWLGSGCRMPCKVFCALCCVIVICRLTAAKFGRRECSLLHLNGNRNHWDPIFLHAVQGVASTINPLLRATLSVVMIS